MADVGRPPGFDLSDDALEELRRAYASGGWSQRRLAEKAGIGKSTVGDLMNGHTTRTTLAKVADVLGVSLPQYFPQLELQFEITAEFVEDAKNWLEDRDSPLIVRGILREQRTARGTRRKLLETKLMG